MRAIKNNTGYGLRIMNYELHVYRLGVKLERRDARPCI